MPNAVNMLNVNNVLLVPDPVWQPMRDAVRNAMQGQGFQVRLIDCIELHRTEGQVHCGTNVRRAPSQAVRRWWTYSN
jgi:N-dimethylarginine dimethylaminohydrolase